MLKSFFVALLLLIAAPAAAQGGDAAERQAVLAGVERLFAAMLARDAAAIPQITDPAGVVTAITMDGAGGSSIATSTWAEFAQRLPQAPAPIRERMFDPEVRVHGDLALVWSRYDLWIGDSFSHCGTDLFEMVRRDGRWLMLHASFTRERTGCERR
ncbi:MAG: DUF4440 domain-containing protein [Sphingosinicella sp.]|uniref:DUF4440 domain-containing protein n=1 Tax=Sphingosinicella sp. TaxID=1917971 RepID=UPI0040377E87